jgi:CDP-glucose 4,6-dehydratase
LEGMGIDRDFWKGKRVFLTGHTGFKGGWLALWLSSMGARVHGYALAPATTPDLFTTAKIADHLATSTIADIRDTAALLQALQRAQPEIIYHLAAQPLVRHSYQAPLETYAVNVMGTVNLLEAVRSVAGVRTVVNITTDKCYENREQSKPYIEDEALGGYDPYSSSKACSELVTSAYRRSFMEPLSIGLASARAGNVIGGGDWSDDRLLPDFLRAIDAGKTVMIRYPSAIRPWQHVLEPLSGYLCIAERLAADARFAQAWNFGPEDSDARSVEWIVNSLCNCIPGAAWQRETAPQPHEAGTLKLDSAKAKQQLNWRPRWNLDTALKKTVAWHQAWKCGVDMEAFSLAQICEYQESRPQ